jgi:Zn-finger nucleic acid-binding protein
MMVVEYEKVEVDHCVQCEGTWFDRGELALLFDDLDASAYGLLPEQIAALTEAATQEKPRKCPICHEKMRKVHVGPLSNILIDVCPQGDGLWFDDMEVAALAQQIIDTGSVASDKAIAFLGKVFLGSEVSEQAEGETE